MTLWIKMMEFIDKITFAGRFFPPCQWFGPSKCSSGHTLGSKSHIKKSAFSTGANPDKPSLKKKHISAGFLFVDKYKI